MKTTTSELRGRTDVDIVARILAGLGTGRIHRCAVCNRGSCNAITCWIPDHRRTVDVDRRLRMFLREYLSLSLSSCPLFSVASVRKIQAREREPREREIWLANVPCEMEAESHYGDIGAVARARKIGRFDYHGSRHDWLLLRERSLRAPRRGRGYGDGRSAMGSPAIHNEYHQTLWIISWRLSSVSYAWPVKVDALRRSCFRCRGYCRGRLRTSEIRRAV